jgi:predicted ATPase/DNA-binding winged helix-turn-helix (wHTH) protein
MPETPAAPPPSLTFGAFHLDLQARRLSRGTEPVALPPRYFDVLAFLAGSGGRLVTKDELLDAVWGHRHVSESVLKVAVNALRQALGEDAKAPRHLETVARHGYRFVGAAPAEAAAPASPPAPTWAAGNLPVPLPGLIGREADSARLRAALASHRLVTLHGPAGVGKTRLVLAEAGHTPPPDGVWLLRLDHLADAAPLLATLARTLGLASGADADLPALTRALAGLRLRLVLDNAEHLVAAVAALTAALLASAPGVQMLITSQVPLRVAGEQVLPLTPLALSAADAAQASAAVQLLVASARRHQPGLALDDAAAGHAAAICQALDGLPLALELAAARVPLLGWAGVHARLVEDGLALLTRGERSAPERHRTLRAALDWACGLLEPAERRLLQSLSVFAGSFTVGAAAAVAGAADEDTLLDGLDTLRERCLLGAADDGPAPRWRLFDSVRSHAAEGLVASGQAPQVQQRLITHMVALFERADTQLLDRPTLLWLAELQPEVANLRAAMRLALADPSGHAQAAALFAACAQFRARGGWRREALQDHAVLRQLPRDAWPPAVQAGFDLAEAQLAAIAQVLPPAPALDSARRAQAVFRALGDALHLYMAVNLESSLLLRLQAPHDQRVDAVARMRALEGAGWSALARRHRRWQEVMLLRDRGDAVVYEEQALAYLAAARALGDEHGAWVAAQALAQLMAVQGRAVPATALLARTVDEMRSAGQLRQNSPVLAQWAVLRVMQDAEPDTVQLLRQAAQALQADGMLWWAADALAWLPAHQGRWDDAARVQAWADSLVRQRGDKRGPMFEALRQRWQGRLAEQPQAERLLALLSAETALDEAGALSLAFTS